MQSYLNLKFSEFKSICHSLNHYDSKLKLCNLSFENNLEMSAIVTI